MSAARDLANFLAAVTAADLPPQALDHAAMLVASTIASAAMGNGLESAGIIKDMARSLGGSPRASVWFDDGAKLPVVAAAQVNAVMSDAAASDDSDLRTIVHCGTPLVATALAAAEHHGGSGEDVLAAIVVGYEAAGRIIDAMTGFRERGFHGSNAAIFAATGAAARLLRLDAEQTTQAIALTATSTGGLAKAADTSVAREGHVAAAEVESITASRPGMTALTGPLHPTDLIDMAHSPAYFLAAGVADRNFSWAHASAEKIADPRIHRLIDKVRVGPPPSENAARYRQGATVTIRTTDGRNVTSTVYAPKGAGILGIAWTDIDAKYRTL